MLDGDKDLDPESLNANGITIRFNKAIQRGGIDIKPEGGKSLGWIAEWGGESVTITPRQDEGLVTGIVYVIEITGVKDAVGQELNTTITFTTKA